MSTNDDDNYIKGLHFIASYLNATVIAKCDAFRYDAITESIVWDDELPPDLRKSSEGLWGIRPILRHRAAIILEEPDVEWDQYWEIGKRLFPNWVGFSKSRLDPAPEIKEFLRQRVAETRRAVSHAIKRTNRKVNADIEARRARGEQSP